MPGIRPMTTDSPGQPPAIEGERVARAGARWTREEEEQLVVEVRAGTAASGDQGWILAPGVKRHALVRETKTAWQPAGRRSGRPQRGELGGSGRCCQRLTRRRRTPAPNPASQSR